MTTHVTRSNLCPQCGYCLDRAIGATTDAPPVADDLSICINCGSLLVYQADLSLRLATSSETEQAMQCENSRRVIQTAQSAIRRRGPQAEAPNA